MSTGSPYKVYKRRWYVLAIVTALNASNAQIWSSFSSVANVAAEYYGVSVSKINTLSMAFSICCFALGIFSLWFTDYVGLNKGVWLGAWLNCVGATVEALGTTNIIPQDMRFNLTLAGQIFAGMAQMSLFVPTKVAEFWFPPNERTLATSLMAMANPFGIMLGFGLIPLFVKNPSHIPSMILISSIFAIIFAILSCGFTSSRPPMPPSESAQHTEQEPFLKALKELLTNKSYFLLLMFCGAMIGLSAMVCSLLEEILRPRGYTNEFSGLCVVLMTSFGIVGGTISGILADRTKAFIPIAKIAGGLTCTILPIHCVIMGFPGQEYVIAVLSAVAGIVALMAYAVLLELTVECTYPLVPEATSTGIVYIIGQLHGAAYIFLVESFATNVTVEGSPALDMKRSIFLMAGIMTLFCVIFIIFFDTEYKRTKKEYISNLETTLTVSSPSLNSENFFPVSYGAIVA